MEESSVPARAKRGCLWYIGVSIAGVSALFVLLIAIAVFLPDEPRQGSIVVSADEHTYLEVVNEQHRINGEGFLADYVNETVVYYIQVGGWFRDTRRVLVFECGNISPQDIRFRRSDSNGQQIEIVRCSRSSNSPCDPAYSDVVFTFAVPKRFDELVAHSPVVRHCP